MSALIFLTCFAYLGWIFYISFKKTIPQWMHKFFYSQRHIDVSQDSNASSAVGFFQWALVFLACFALYYILGTMGLGFDYMQNHPAWLLTFIIICIGIIFLIGNNFKNHFAHYTDNVFQEEKKNEVRQAYGAKGWASPELLEKSLGGRGKGLHVGSHFTWNGQGHMMTVGGSRGGKGVNLILPALLSDDLKMPDAPSFVVLDPKGENLAVAGNYLKSAGYNVLAVNPFAIPEVAQFGNARFNPFDLFNGNDPDFDKYADMISFALVPQTSHANDYFDKSARNYMTLYIRHMMTQDVEAKNFRTLYKWLRLSGTERTDLLQQMSKNEAFDGDIKDEARAIAGQMLNDGGRTVESIYSTVRTATDVFKDTQLRDSVSASDVDLKTLAKEKTAVFVCLSPADLDRCQAWLRLFFGSIMRGLTKYYNPARKVVLLMDEFPTLGALKEFEIAAGFLAGYNVTLWPVMQDLTQLKNLYPNSWETFVNNAIVRHYLAVGDNFTADYLSKRMPKDLKFLGNNHDGSPREMQKYLLEPQEVMAWPNIILEVKGVDRPGSLKKIPYWEINQNASPNPFRN
ncbi:type IV secretory system conjugative DNA transfer family protein [Spirosoma foliorum]|uniref:Type IV secretory system conjugative DNA transfer family protein n=1 Tax=Spirosoma foliorum TaxID=2710596 RepID=A0A7G5H2Q6_9BACT|nr:type IV secretory system conjugative DNA transfer family protein [Spirosoma foliorum]QMW05398.1 type IV secretory system conjugative DNA transfer family protein [Spirosoma foliorum]